MSNEPFKFLHEALRFYRENNPTVRSGLSEDDEALWWAVHRHLWRVFKNFGVTSLPVRAFCLVYMQEPNKALTPKQIADCDYPSRIRNEMRLPQRHIETIYMYLSSVREELEDEFIDAALLPESATNYQ